MFGWIRNIVSVLYTLIMIVERPGEGEVKRQEVIAKATEALKTHIKLPKWAMLIFARESFVGWLVDVIVGVLNDQDFFGTPEDGETA